MCAAAIASLDGTGGAEPRQQRAFARCLGEGRGLSHCNHSTLLCGRGHRAVHRPPLSPEHNVNISLEPISVQCSYTDALVLLRILNGWSSSSATASADEPLPIDDTTDFEPNKTEDVHHTRACRLPPTTVQRRRRYKQQCRASCEPEASSYELVFTGERLGMTLRPRPPAATAAASDQPSTSTDSRDSAGQRTKRKSVVPALAVVESVDMSTFFSAVALPSSQVSKPRVPQQGDTIIAIGGNSVADNPYKATIALLKASPRPVTVEFSPASHVSEGESAPRPLPPRNQRTDSAPRMWHRSNARAGRSASAVLRFSSATPLLTVFSSRGSTWARAICSLLPASASLAQTRGGAARRSAPAAEWHASCWYDSGGG